MFCRNCGKELGPAAEFCTNCGARPLNGNQFCHVCGAQTLPIAEVCVRCGARLIGGPGGGVSDKSRTAATLLAFFLGGLGIHRFYLGHTGIGVAQLILYILGWATIWIFGIGAIFFVAVGIWALVDFIMLLAGTMRDSNGKLVSTW
jgi:TM2 domain-containing membrane protein YozV/ribosomal protein L40E